MIGIQLEGDSDFLDTLNDTNIEITVNNPLLGDAENLSPGSYSMPFKLPASTASPKNEEKLHHPGVIENNEAFQIQKASLFYDGVPFKKGNLKVNTASDDKSLETFFTFGLNALDPNLKTKRLREVINENVVIDNSDFSKRIYFKRTVDGPYDVLINGKSYPGEGGLGFHTINDLAFTVDFDARLAANTGVYVPYPIYHAAGSGDVSPGGLTAPFIELIVAKLTGTYPYTVTPSVDPFVELSISVDDPKNWVFESFDMAAYYAPFQSFLAPYIAGTFPSNKYRFPVFFNVNLYDGDNVPKTSEIINGVNSSGLILNDEKLYQNNNSLQPFLLLKYVLDQISASFGFTYDGDFYSDSELPNILIENSTTLDVPLDYVNHKFVFWRRSFNLNELVPDITVIEFLKGIASRYNLAVFYNEITQKVSLKYRETIAKSSAYEDVTPVPKNSPVTSSGITNITDNRVTGYTLICKKDDTDKLNTTDEQLTIGVPQETIEITCGRISTSRGMLISGSGIVRGPRVWRKNNDQGYKLRVFHFLGMVNNGIFSYQAADINCATYAETLADGSVPGIYSRCFLYWLMFKKNWRMITVNVNWPLRMLMNFNFELKRRFDRSNYLVNSLKITMTNKSVQATQVELYTMN